LSPSLDQAGVSPLLQKQLEELAKRNASNNSSKSKNKGSGFVVIGQDRVEPLQALQNSGQEVCSNEISPGICNFCLWRLNLHFYQKQKA
jgi:hypothetical protein